MMKVFRVVLEFKENNKTFYLLGIVTTKSKQDITIPYLISTKEVFNGIYTYHGGTIDKLIQQGLELIGIYDVVEIGYYDEHGHYVEIQNYVSKSYKSKYEGEDKDD